MISLKLKYLIITSVIFGVLYGLFLIFHPAEGFSTSWNESFESLDVGNIDNQGYFTTQGQNYWSVSTEQPFTGSKGLKVLWESESYKIASPFFTSPTATDTGSEEVFRFRVRPSRDNTNSIAGFHIHNSEGENICGVIIIRATSGHFYVGDKAGVDIAPTKRILKDNWATITLTANFETQQYSIDVNTNDEDWTTFTDYFTNNTPKNIQKIRFECFDCGIYFDDFEYPEAPPTEPRVWATSPASETEITDLETPFEFSWEGLDDWDTLSVVFKNRDTGIFSLAQELLITDSPSGSEAFNFSDLAPDRNGKFYFFATSTRSVMEVMSGMFLTGRYSYEWSEDLVDPEHWFTFNIGGISQIFSMSEFDTWYLENSKFAEPTAMFLAIQGFFEPIFNKIGEFGNRISDFFNTNEAYSQGYEIGKAIPYFSYFVGQVSDFIGGFPLMKWLFVIILLLVGIFVFRLILKFIPFIGGG